MVIPSLFHKRLVFMHIEKTGGTSVTDTLKSYYAADDICPETGNSFLYWMQRDLEKYSFFSAHADIKNIKAIPEPKICVLVLRNPIYRALSYYEFLRYHSPTDVHGDPRIRVAQVLGVEEFFTEAPPTVLQGFSNFMTARLSNSRWPIGRKALELAIANLETFSHIGVSENLAGFMTGLLKDLGLSAPPETLHRRKTSEMLPMDHPLRLHAIPDAVIRRIEEINDMDIELYNHVVEKYCGGLPLPPEQVTLSDTRMAQNIINSDGTRMSFTQPSLRGIVAHGPYKRVLTGNWKTIFSLAADAEEIDPETMIAELDVYSTTAGGVLSARKIKAKELVPDKLTQISLDFQLRTSVSDLEFRINKLSPHRLFWHRDVQLTSAEGPASAKDAGQL